MKHTFYIYLLTALTASLCCSCTREEAAPGSGEYPGDPHTLSVTLEEPGKYTRASLTEMPKVHMEFRWEGEDSIGVSGSGGSNIRFTVKPGTISEDGRDVLFETSSDIPAGKLTALFPYQDKAVVGENGIKAVFPAVQKQGPNGAIFRPDVAANLMMGQGTRNAGLKFYNLMSILKIGRHFEKATLLKRIEFRDLSGAPVSGELTAGWKEGKPEISISGNGKTLVMDFGEGMEIQENSFRFFFLIVPPREYKKGFEIAFIDGKGDRTVRTVGTRMGKTLLRNTYYSIGDVPLTAPKDPNTKQVLKENATVITPEKADMIRVLDSYSDYLKDDKGNYIYDRNSRALMSTSYELEVHKDMACKVGDYMIFDRYFPGLPNGAAYRIAYCEPTEDADRLWVKIVQEANPAAPFKEVTVGAPIWDAGGNLDENAGVELDIASYVTDVVTKDGKNLKFTRSPEGDLVFDEASTEVLLGKYINDFNMSTPKIGHAFGDDNGEIKLSARMDFKMKCALRIMDGSFQYIHCTVVPKLEISIDAAIRKEISLEMWEAESITFKTAPVPVPGTCILVNPEISFGCGMSAFIGGELSAGITFSEKLGNFGVSYNRGNGFTMRQHVEKFNKKEFDIGYDLKSYVGVSASTSMKIGLCFYGTLSLGLTTQANLKVESSHSIHGSYLSVIPEMNFYPYAKALTVDMDDGWDEYNILMEFEPIWKRCVFPNVAHSFENKMTYSEKYYEIQMDNVVFLTQIPIKCEGYDYQIVTDSIDCPLIDNLVFAVEILTGDDISFYAGFFPDYCDMVMDEYKRHGIPHIFKNGFRGLSAPKVIKTIEIGEMTTADSVFNTQGRASYNFENNVPYGARMVAFLRGTPYYRRYITGENDINVEVYDDLGQNKSLKLIEGGALEPFIIYWPNRSNGEPYTKE